MTETGKELIEKGEWAECRICLDAFRRQRKTLRYCNNCKNGFCEGEHGSFSYKVGVCVICGATKNYAPQN